LSSEFTILAATIPSIPASPTTTYDGITDTITIDFNPPTDDGGVTITGYVIQIQHADNSWSTETSNCDGLNNSTVKSTTACTIPASVLRASPFSLPQASSVTAKVTAQNSLGSSSDSAAGNGATMPSVPNASTALTRDEINTSSSQVVFTWVAPSSTGEAPILDYTI
jgi:hypothetical protein